ncbi:MAG: AmmeMemoRadiSam system protein B [Candidatus Omnitrophota bacterium]
MKLLVLIFTAMFFLCGAPADAKVSDLHGAWYSASADALMREIKEYLAAAQPGKIDGDVIGVIAPHAGIRFSGSVAAYAYNAAAKNAPKTVIVVGFTHRRYFPARIAVLDDATFSTPLGSVPIDGRITKKLLAYDDRIMNIPQAFISENSIEMQIPFIQVAMKDARVVLVALCDQARENNNVLADALYAVLGDEKDFVIIASSDMCHYLPYAEANEKDRQTAKILEEFVPDLFYQKSLRSSRTDSLMCGYGAVYSVMTACKKLGADEIKILKYGNSGDTSGEKDKVVGYLSAAFIKPAEQKKEAHGMLNETQKKKLLTIARNAINQYLKTGKRIETGTEDETLKQNMGAFVTLHKNGRLRGCIGHMTATGPLCVTVRDMAIAAAVEDPRFSPVTLDEMENIDLEISALSPMRQIRDYNEIEVGKHGVMVRMGSKGGVYLPQVADEAGWDREQFMNSLCAQKAGIPRDAWKTGECDIYIFTAEVFGEKEMAKE